MDETIRKIIERPFSTELLKQRQGPGGRTFTYVEIQHYVGRLNEAFTGIWSWEITRREIVDDQVIVEGRLTAGGVVKTGLGGAQVTRRRDDGRPVSIADDTKKAEADAIKRACRLLGIGGHLYSDDIEDNADNAATPRAPQTPPPQAQRRVQGAVPAQHQHERQRLSQKQYGAIFAVARDRGYDDSTLRSHVKRTYGVEVNFLTRRQASELIGALSANGDGRQPGEEG